jgi:hypothetical protein
MEKGTPEATGLSYRATDDFIARYANHTFLESSLYDLKLVFGQSDQKAGPSVINQHTAITISWPQVKILLYFLRSNLAGYELVHGKVALEPGIVNPPPDRPPTIPNVKQDLVDKVWAVSKTMYDEFMKENPEARAR